MVLQTCFFFLSPTFSIAAQNKINEPAIVDIRHDRVTIEWTTPSDSHGEIEFGETTKLGASVKDLSLSKGHVLILRNLKPQTRYFFKIISKSQQKEVNSTDLYSFKTEKFEETEKGVILKILSPPYATLLSPQKAIISWETNKPTHSIVTYGFKKQKKPTVIYSEVETTTHIVTLTNLIPNTRYFYQAKSRDPSGHIVSSSYFSFVTKRAKKLEMLPMIKEGPAIAFRRETEAKIEWKTDRPCTSYITWGKLPLASFQTKKEINKEFSSSHLITLEGLKAGMRYYYIIFLEDTDGRKNKSEVFSITIDKFH